jgi:hypothetical protein
MIRLLAHALPTLSPQQIVSLSQPSCASPAGLIVGRGVHWRAKTQIIRPRESLALYKSFNPLWLGKTQKHNSKLTLSVLKHDRK